MREIERREIVRIGVDFAASEETGCQDLGRAQHIPQRSFVTGRHVVHGDACGQVIRRAVAMK